MTNNDAQRRVEPASTLRKTTEEVYMERMDELKDERDAATARAQRAEAATVVFRRELQRRQDISYDSITQDSLDSDAAAIGQPLLDRTQRAEERAERLREALIQVVLDIEGFLGSPLIDDNLILSTGGLWGLKRDLPKLRALTAADEEG